MIGVNAELIGGHMRLFNERLKKILAVGCCLALAGSMLTACSDDFLSTDDEPKKEDKEQVSLSDDVEDDGSGLPMWAIYWYICGSDLESEGGAATYDIEELCDVYLPDDVQVVIETGGANEWQNDFTDPNELNRFLYSGGDLALVDSAPSQSMGDPDTLSDFLSFCEINYPAQHSMVVFWNHGGGSMDGVEFDEIYDDDSLSLAELDEAFSEAVAFKGSKYDIVGFDTCLMSTVENAAVMYNYADYMVASEETEPGNGWYYTGIASALYDNPRMSPENLGVTICDTYLEGCQMYGTDDEATLSLIDLAKLDVLISALNNVSLELVYDSSSESNTVSKFTRGALKAENYGGNNDEQGYHNQVDIGDLIKRNKKVLDETGDGVIDALKEVVLYRVNGQYRKHSTGLSMFFPYGLYGDELDRFDDMTPNQLYSRYLRYMMEGYYPDGTQDIMAAIEEQEQLEESGIDTSEIESVSVFDDNFEIVKTDEGYLSLQIPVDSIDSVKSVQFMLYILDYNEEIMIALGSDNNLYADWDTGYFEDNFNGTWGSIDGNICFMELTFEGEEYNLYSVPIKLNGEECVLRVAYNYTDECYHILGARKGDNGGAANRKLIKIKPGDEITTILYAMDISENPVTDELVEFDMDTFTVTEDTTFYDEEIGDGELGFIYSIEDLAGNNYLSSVGFINITDGEIETSVE